MKPISPEMVELIDSQSLADIMARAGHFIDHQAGNNIFYNCPFHSDHNASLCVTLSPKDGTKGEWYCHGCGEKGHGAIGLQARLMNLDRTNPKDFVRICIAIAKTFNLQDPTDPDRQANDNWRRARRADLPSPEIAYTYKPWDDYDLRALGCKIRQAFVTRGGVSQAVLDGNGNPVKIYSWAGDGYYRKSCKQCDFNPDCITDIFGIRPVESFVTEQRADTKTGELTSWVVKSSTDYPIFDMRYEDSNGWKSKKYEPMARPSKDGQSYKFTWWFEGGKRREEDSSLRQALYGDREFMEAFATGTVKSSPSHPSNLSSFSSNPSPLPSHSSPLNSNLSSPPSHPSPVDASMSGVLPSVLSKPTIEVITNPDETKPRYRTKFLRLIICSGPRDGINVYFHSNAHVCWPHSEVTALSERTVARLLDIAHEVYVLFDSDKTGLRNAEDIALQNIGVRVIYLPRDLNTVISGRTGRPCKDAAEYFSNYPTLLAHNRAFRGKTINDHFESLLIKAHSMKFWEEQYTQRKTENGVDKYVKIKYTLNPTNMAQFLGASGMYRYTDTSGERQYVMIDSEGVHILPKEDIHLTAKQLMKGYLEDHPRYYKDDLVNMISLTTKLSPSTIEEIPQVELNFRAWGEDFDYFYFRNGALHVTPDEVRLVPYSQMPFAVNVDAKVDGLWHPTNDRLFSISINPDYDTKRKEHEHKLRNCHTDNQREEEHRRFSQYERLWKYKVEFSRPIDQMPPVIQYIYDMGRIYWKLEEGGGQLSADQQQFQDMQFINKVSAIGYTLHRYRTSVIQRMATVTDYSILREERANGRNGKSTLWQLLSFARRGLWIDGKNFKKRSETIGQNFHELRLTVHGFIFVDDLSADVDADKFYNMVQRIRIKSLYNNEVTLTAEDSPKLFVTYNKPFNVNEPSTYGRLWPTYASDYYHSDNMMGTTRTRSMASKFHHDIFKPRSEREGQYIREFLAQCLQFYLQEYQRSIEAIPIIAPVDQEGLVNMMYGEFRIDKFLEWANIFFDPEEHPEHFAHPIPLTEMAISLIRFQGTSIASEANVMRVMKNGNLRRDLTTYCSIYNLIQNPDVVLSDSDRRTGRVSRSTAWCTELNDFKNYELDYSRHPRQKLSTGCIYIYQQGASVQFPVPLSPNDVLRAPKDDTSNGDLVN